MTERGVYVRETFPGVTEVRAVDRNGHTVRQLTLPTILVTERDVTESTAFLDFIDPCSALRLVSG
jgi:hypothetical protein